MRKPPETRVVPVPVRRLYFGCEPAVQPFLRETLGVAEATGRSSAARRGRESAHVRPS